MVRSARALVFLVLRNLAIGFVALWLGYVIVGNVLLSTGAIERIVSGHGGGQLLQIGAATTWWFGRVHARDLTLRIQDSSMECLIVAPEADLSISLSHLPLRTFHASRVEIRGLKFLLRMKVDSVRGIEQRASAWPPIPGLPDPPLKPAGPQAPPDLIKIYQGWSVHLEGINASLDELWMEEFRYRGKGQVAGAFLLRPQRLLEIMEAELNLWEGNLTVGQHTVLRYPRVAVQCKVRPFDPTAGRGKQVFEEFSGRVSADGIIPDAAFARVYVTPKPLQKLRSGPGRFEADVTMIRGKIAPSSSIVLSVAELELTAGPVRVSSDLHLEARTPARGDGASTALRAGNTRVWNERGTSADSGPVVSPETRLSVSYDGADLSKPVNPVAAELAMPAAEADARWINGLAGAPAKWHAVQGRIRASAGLHFDVTQQWVGTAELRVRDGRVGGDGWNAGGNVSIAVRATAGPNGKTGSLRSVELAADDVHILAKGREEAGMWARAAIDEGGWQGLPPKGAEVLVRARAGPGGNVLRMITGEGLMARLGVELASAAEVSAVARGSLRQGHKQVELLRGSAGLVEGTGSWADGRGTFLFRSGPASARITTGGGTRVRVGVWE